MQELHFEDYSTRSLLTPSNNSRDSVFQTTPTKRAVMSKNSCTIPKVGLKVLKISSLTHVATWVCGLGVLTCAASTSGVHEPFKIALFGRKGTASLCGLLGTKEGRGHRAGRSVVLEIQFTNQKATPKGKKSKNGESSSALAYKCVNFFLEEGPG